MLIRYVDGPWQGDTVETSCGEIEGVHNVGGGVLAAVRYRVDRTARTAHFLGYGQHWNAVTLKDLDGHAVADEPLLTEASDDQLRAELDRRGYKPRLVTPMRRRRRDFPRSGFGQVWPSG